MFACYFPFVPEFSLNLPYAFLPYISRRNRRIFGGDVNILYIVSRLLLLGTLLSLFLPSFVPSFVSRVFLLSFFSCPPLFFPYLYFQRHGVIVVEIMHITAPHHYVYKPIVRKCVWCVHYVCQRW